MPAPASQTVKAIFNANGGALPDGTPAYVDVTVGGVYADLPAPTRQGYVFSGWLYGMNLVANGTTCTATSDHTLFAIWTLADPSSKPYTPSALFTFNPSLGTFQSGVQLSDGETIEDTAVLKTAVEETFYKAMRLASPDPTTPLGRMQEWLALNFATCQRVNVQNANQLLIGSAAGQQLDAIAKWFGMTRRPASATSVSGVVLEGAASTTIPAGVTARTDDGHVYTLVSDVTLDSEGVGVGTFVCTETGPIPCRAGELNSIDTSWLGWNSVSNPSDGVMGRDFESDDSLRSRIENSRFSGIGFLGAMKNAIEGVVGVRGAMVVENYTNEEKTVHGIDAMSPHSIFVCVDCTEDAYEGVAKAIFDTKPCGTGYHGLGGATEVTYPIVDAFGNSYNVLFHTPGSCVVRVRLVVRNRSYSGVDLAGDVRNAIISWASARDYGIGETVYSAEIIGAVEAAVPGVVVLGCGVTEGGGGENGDTTAGIHELAYLEVPASQKAVFTNSAQYVIVEER